MKSRSDHEAPARWPRRLALLAPAAMLLLVAACSGKEFTEQDRQEDLAFARRILGTTGQPTSFKSPEDEEEKDVVVCPEVEVLPNAAYYDVYAPRQPVEPENLRYQGTFSKTARECDFRPDYLAIKYAFAGRVIVGPAGGPGQVTLPFRIQLAGKNEKVVWNKQFELTVTVPPGAGSQFFTHVGDDMVYQLRIGEELSDFRIYMGFDTEDGWVRPVASGEPDDAGFLR